MSEKNNYFFFLLFFVIISTLTYPQNILCLPDAKAQSPKDAAGEARGPKYAEGAFVYDSKGRRDPFSPLVTPDGRIIEIEPADSKDFRIRLQGIVYDSSSLSYAIINGAVVKTGEWVGGYQVGDIQPKKVILIKGEEKIEMELRKEK